MLYGSHSFISIIIEEKPNRDPVAVDGTKR